MQRLLAALFAVGAAVVAVADTQVVCSITPQAQTACSALTVSQAAQLDPCRCNPTPTPTPTPEPSVYDDAIALWKLDEASGTRADSIGSLDLTDNNTVGYANMGPSGVVAGTFNGTDEYLSKTSFPALSSKLSVGMWVSAVVDDNDTHYGCFQISYNTNQYLFVRYGSRSDIHRVGITLEGYNGTAFISTSQYYNTPDELGWHYVQFSWDPVAGTITTAIDGTAGTGASGAGGSAFGSSTLYVGRAPATVPAYFNGRIGRVALYDGDAQALYNSGHGKSYADLTTAEKIGLGSYWDLDEASGNRVDSHGSNTLTDNNTVGSATNSYPANLPGRVASFVAANSEYLTRASFTMPGSYAVSIWVHGFDGYPGTPANVGTLLSCGAYPLDAQVHFSNYGYFGGNIVADGTNYYSAVGYYGDWVPYDQGPKWHHFLIEYDAATRKTTVRIDNRSTALESSAIAGTRAATPSTLYMGGGPGGIGITNCTNRVSVVAVWPRLLTSDERTALYNSGDGAVLP